MPLAFFLLVLLPVTELTILIKVGGLIGVLPTIAIILCSASLGLFLMRREGFSTLTRARQKMAEGQLPAHEMLEGIVIAFCGALLLAPGLITDCIALCGLIPPIRKLIIKRILKSGRFQLYTAGGNSFDRGGSPFNQSFGHAGRQGKDDAIEGEFRRED